VEVLIRIGPKACIQFGFAAAVFTFIAASSSFGTGASNNFCARARSPHTAPRAGSFHLNISTVLCGSAPSSAASARKGRLSASSAAAECGEGESTPAIPPDHVRKARGVSFATRHVCWLPFFQVPNQSSTRRT